MKKIFYILISLSFVFWSGCTVITQTSSNNQQYSDPTFNVLNNYGQWMDVPGLGTVWRPYDENNWQPYYNGQWVWTDQGWMWESDEPYGWVVYHYGNWDYTIDYGWVWLPNYVWRPARVRWYHSDGYVGWAPMPPPGVSSAAVIYNSGYVNRVWVFVPEQRFYNKQVGQYRTHEMYPNMRVLRSANGERGPELRNVERFTHRRIEPVRPVRDEMNAGNRKLIRVRVPNDTELRDRTLNNANREERRQINPPARNEGQPEPGNKTRTRDQNPAAPTQPQIPPNRERERNNSNLRNNNGRNENNNRNDQNNFNNKDRNIKPPAKPVETQKPIPQKPPTRERNNNDLRNNNGRNENNIRNEQNNFNNREQNIKPTAKPVETRKPVPQKPLVRERVNDTIRSKNNNEKKINNPKPEPKKSETKNLERKKPEPKKSNIELKKKEEKSSKQERVKKEKEQKNKIRR